MYRLFSLGEGKAIRKKEKRLLHNIGKHGLGEALFNFHLMIVV